MNQTTPTTQALQAVEQQLHQVLVHKQSLRGKMLELESALRAVQTTSTAYKALGNILVQQDPKTLADELSVEKESLALRQKTLETQEARLLEKKKELQDAITTQLGDKHEQ